MGGVDEGAVEFVRRIKELEEQLRRAETARRQARAVLEIFGTQKELFDRLAAELHGVIVRYAEAVRGLRGVLQPFVVDSHIEELVGKFVLDLAREFGYRPHRRSLEGWIGNALYTAYMLAPEDSDEREWYLRLWRDWVSGREG
jgi:hypothetical protein